MTISDKRLVDEFARLARAIKEHGVKAAVQIQYPEGSQATQLYRRWRRLLFPGEPRRGRPGS